MRNSVAHTMFRSPIVGVLIIMGEHRGITDWVLIVALQISHLTLCDSVATEAMLPWMPN